MALQRMARLVPRGNRQISGTENESRIKIQALAKQRLHATPNGQISTSRLKTSRPPRHRTKSIQQGNTDPRNHLPPHRQSTKQTQSTHFPPEQSLQVPDATRSLLGSVAKTGSIDIQSSVTRYDDPAVSGPSQRKQEDHSVQITPTAHWRSETGLPAIGANIDRCSTAPSFTKTAGELAPETWKDTKRKYTTATFCVIYGSFPSP